MNARLITAGVLGVGLLGAAIVSSPSPDVKVQAQQNVAEEKVDTAELLRRAKQEAVVRATRAAPKPAPEPKSTPPAEVDFSPQLVADFVPTVSTDFAPDVPEEPDLLPAEPECKDGVCPVQNTSRSNCSTGNCSTRTTTTYRTYQRRRLFPLFRR